MRLLGNSIREGESITPILYVPKAVWSQDCKDIALITKKCQIFKWLAELLPRHTILMQKDAIKPNVSRC